MSLRFATWGQVNDSVEMVVEEEARGHEFLYVNEIVGKASDAWLELKKKLSA